MLIKILIAFPVIAAVLAVVVATRPSDFRITRSTTVSAPPSAVFAQVNDFHNWDAWSPWAKIDPAMKASFDGPASGTGASYAWVGNNKIGEGRMTILESRPDELVKIKLEFLKPFAATNTAEFTFESQGNQTLVTWSMSGRNNFMSKVFQMIMNMEKMLGAQFEQGLAQMKAAAEAAPGK